MRTIKLAVVAILFMTFSCTDKKKEDTTPETKVVAENTETMKEEVANGYEVGDIVQDFSLKNVDGKMVSMADYKDAKGFILTFTCNTCPYSVAYEDRLIALDKKYASKGYPVIAINPNNPEAKPDDSFEAMQTRAKEKGFTFPYMLDVGQKVYPVFGATRTPHMYVLAKTDKGYQVKYIGAIDDNAKSPEEVSIKYVENAIEALEKGQKPTPNLTKSIGCPIKANRA